MIELETNQIDTTIVESGKEPFAISDPVTGAELFVAPPAVAIGAVILGAVLATQGILRKLRG